MIKSYFIIRFHNILCINPSLFSRKLQRFLSFQIQKPAFSMHIKNNQDLN